ncbi:MAG: adenylyl-sulfate kinase [Pseudanabaenaceae cyanobacterium bins.68]|nr:adenylyl-sulfate kinase [Pseudanabaenaceae cyanobacterium bins.68]
MTRTGTILWLTGLSGAGKTTIALGVLQILQQRQRAAELLDGDIIRTNLSHGLGFSKQDRDLNVLRVGFVANLLAKHGVIAISAVISPYRDTRQQVRASASNFLEVYVSAPLEICESRDVKGLYAKARAGKITGFTGIDDPYEPPHLPEVTCYTAVETIDQSVDKVIAALTSYGYL